MKGLNRKPKPGFVYIMSNTRERKSIKVGRTNIDPELRALQLTKQTGSRGEYFVEWSSETYDMETAERLLHSKLRDYWEEGEFFRFPLKPAIKLATQLVDFLHREIGANGKLKKAKRGLKRKPVSRSVRRKWEQVKRTKHLAFIRKTIDLCLKEGKPGLPHRQQFISVRSRKFTKIATVHLYIQKSHIRVYLVIDQAIIIKAKRLITGKFKYYGTEVPSITEWKYGLQFLVKTNDEFSVLRKWLRLGKLKG